MKIESKLFLSARKEKVSSLVIKKQEGRSFMYLCFENEYNKATEYIEVDTEIEVRSLNNFDSSRICFMLDTYKKSNVDFIKSLKLGMDLKFKVLSFNSCDLYNGLGLVRHELSVEVNGKERLLDIYVGLQNTASPVL